MPYQGGTSSIRFNVNQKAIVNFVHYNERTNAYTEATEIWYGKCSEAVARVKLGSKGFKQVTIKSLDFTQS